MSKLKKKVVTPVLAGCFFFYKNDLVHFFESEINIFFDFCKQNLLNFDVSYYGSSRGKGHRQSALTAKTFFGKLLSAKLLSTRTIWQLNCI